MTRRPGSARGSVERVEHLLVRGVASGRLLGVDEAAIRDDFEHPAARFDELHVDVRIAFFEGCRQTGGFGAVVSDDAELDGHLHVGTLSLEEVGSGPGGRDEAHMFE